MGSPLRHASRNPDSGIESPPPTVGCVPARTIQNTTSLNPGYGRRFQPATPWLLKLKRRSHNSERRGRKGVLHRRRTHLPGLQKGRFSRLPCYSWGKWKAQKLLAWLAWFQKSEAAQPKERRQDIHSSSKIPVQSFSKRTRRRRQWRGRRSQDLHEPRSFTSRRPERYTLNRQTLRLKTESNVEICPEAPVPAFRSTPTPKP